MKVTIEISDQIVERYRTGRETTADDEALYWAFRDALPRPIQAGDKVFYWTETGTPGTVLCVDDGKAWVRWDGLHGTYALANLVRVDDGADQ